MFSVCSKNIYLSVLVPVFVIIIIIIIIILKPRF